MAAHIKGTTSIQIMITHLKPVHVCNAVYLCVNTRATSTKRFYFCLDLCVSSSQTMSFLGQGQKNSLWGARPSQISSHWSFFLLFFLLLLLPCLRKRSLRQRIEIADIHISAEPSRDLSTNILSVSVCLQFFWSSNPPSHPPPRSAPIGSRSCSTGRLLAPSHGNLAGAARICPRTSRSPAFCLWMDDTESEARDRRWRTQSSEMNMQLYG